jgi:hypothetical protein
VPWLCSCMLCVCGVQFQDRHGKATTWFADGSVYVGDYREDKHWGFGELTLATGESYRGGWSNHLKSGLGTFVYKSGAVYKCVLALFSRCSVRLSLLKCRECAYSEGVWPSCAPRGPTLVMRALLHRGNWELDVRSGLGEMRYADGALYVGDWLRDKRHGQGRHEFPPPMCEVYDGQVNADPFTVVRAGVHNTRCVRWRHGWVSFPAVAVHVRSCSGRTTFSRGLGR